MGGNLIGLEAIWKDAGFLAGISEYISRVREGESSTTGASAKITQGLAAIGGSIVTGALTAAVAGIAAVTGAAIAAVPAFLGWAETLDGVGDVLGTNADQSAALAVAIQGVGGNVDQMTAQMAFLTRGLETADGKLGPTGEALKALGISFKDANGNMLPATDILSSVADVVGNMPDGLEKTKIMMSLFGKSGKDLSDVMGALANGGLAEADKMAQQLGLSLGDDAANGAISLGREFNKLKMIGQGIMVSFGKELAPAVAELVARFKEMALDALPKIRSILPQIGAIVTQIAGFIINSIPVVFGIISNIVNFLVNNKPVVIGALAGITAAIAFWAYTTISAAIPAITAFIAAMGPAILVILAISAVVGALAWAWENNFLGMRDTITQFWDNSLKPALQAIWNWLSINIPLAIQTVVQFWTGVLLPAIQAVAAFFQNALTVAIQAGTAVWTNVFMPVITAVWGFISTYFLPLISALANVIGAVLNLAVTVVSVSWQNILLPAIQAVWAFIVNALWPVFMMVSDFLSAVLVGAITVAVGAWNTLFMPVIQAVWAIIQNKLIPVVTALANVFTNVLAPALKVAAEQMRLQFEAAINWIKDQLQRLADWLNEIADRFRHLFGGGDGGNQGNASLDVGTGGGGGTGGGPTPGSTATIPTPSASHITNNTAVNFGGVNINNAMDLALFDSHIRNVIRAEMRG